MVGHRPRAFSRTRVRRRRRGAGSRPAQAPASTRAPCGRTGAGGRSRAVASHRCSAGWCVGDVDEDRAGGAGERTLGQGQRRQRRRAATSGPIWFARRPARVMTKPLRSSPSQARVPGRAARCAEQRGAAEQPLIERSMRDQSRPPSPGSTEIDAAMRRAAPSAGASSPCQRSNAKPATKPLRR